MGEMAHVKPPATLNYWQGVGRGRRTPQVTCTRWKMTRATCQDSCCPTIVRASPVNALAPAAGPGSRRSGQPCSSTSGASSAPPTARADERFWALTVDLPQNACVTGNNGTSRAVCYTKVEKPAKYSNR